MKKTSRRAKRMQRHHLRNKRGAGLNLVSLMDIFTILVFFLLVNSTDVENIPTSSSIKLPDSISRTKPHDQVIVQITDKNIIVDGNIIADVATESVKETNVIVPLKAKLDEIAKRSVAGPRVDAQGKPLQKEVMIQADRLISFQLLRRIMTTCTESQYNSISLAVVQKTNVVSPGR